MSGQAGLFDPEALPAGPTVFVTTEAILAAMKKKLPKAEKERGLHPIDGYPIHAYPSPEEAAMQARLLYLAGNCVFLLTDED